MLGTSVSGLVLLRRNMGYTHPDRARGNGAACATEEWVGSTTIMLEHSTIVTDCQ
jgi:hypothetical protein